MQHSPEPEPGEDTVTRPSPLIVLPALACITIMASKAASGGASAVIEALPVIISIGVIAAGGSLFARFAFERDRLVPRALRSRHALELALFRWADLERHSQRNAIVLAHVTRAKRTERNPSLRDRIERTATRLREGVELGGIDEQLRALIRDSPGQTGVPHRSSRMIPEYVVRKAPVIAASIATAHLILERGSPIVDDVATWAAIFGLLHVLLRTIFLIDDFWRARRRRKSFRALFVTDQPVADGLNRAAIDMYSPRGHMIAIFVGADDADFSNFRSEGAETFAPPRDAALGVVAPYIDHADLLVINVRDHSLREEIRAAASHIAEARRLALDEQAVAHPGFRWLDPMSLRFEAVRATHPATHALRGRIHPVIDSYELYFILFAIAELFMWDGCVPLAGLLAAATIGWVVPNIIGRYRRAAMAPTTLRAPRNARLSRTIDPPGMQRRLATLAFIATVAFILLAVHTHDDKWFRSTWSLGGIAFGVAASWVVVSAGLVGGGLIAVKWYLDWNFRIVVFRRNSVRFAYGHKFGVMATCGRYGQVVALHDEELDKTKTGYNEHREEHHGLWFEIFTEANHTLDRYFFLHDWKTQVAAELDAADFAVFDWAEEVTDNMRWELEAARARLPPDRILIVYDGNRDEGVPDLVARLDASSRRPIRAVPISRGADDQYIWADHTDFIRRLRENLDPMLANLSPEPRPPLSRGHVSAAPLP